jgi:hypothetical protein
MTTNGISYCTREPRIDEVFRIIDRYAPNRVQTGTE